MAMKFTPQQEKAIKSLGTNIIVSAGAGSGKTAVLSERVLYLVKEHDYKLNQFLILTFTNLAAAEMKERIRKKLQDNKLEEAQNVDVSNICTFDSFAYSLVKRYHLLLNVSSQIKIIDSNIISVLTRQNIENIFDEYYLNKDPEFLKLVKKYCFKDDYELKSALFDLYNKSNLVLNKQEFLDHYMDNFCSEKCFNKHLMDFKTLVIDKLDEVLEYSYQLTDFKNYQSSISALIKTCLEQQELDSVIGKVKVVSFPRAPKMDDEEKLVKEQFKKLWSELIVLINDYEGVEKEKEKFELRKGDISTFLKIINRLEKLDQDYKKEHQVYEFSDIAKMSLRLVKEFKEVKEEMKSQLKMIMIDEYQDTSDLQEAFISEIENNNVYMVGDIKQSIYRFRNANPTIFMEKYLKYAKNNGGIKIDLNDNFRSRKEVLANINSIFEKIMTLKIGGADYLKDHIIGYGNLNYLATGDTKQNQNLEIYTYPSTYKSSEIAEIEATLIAKDIIEKIQNKYHVCQMDSEGSYLRPCNYDDFCVIMDRGTEFDTYRKVFADYQIPLFVENDENIAQNQLVLVFKNLLILVKCMIDKEFNSNEFRHSFASVARSFVFSYSDEQIYNTFKNKSFFESQLFIEIDKIQQRNKDLTLFHLCTDLIFSLKIYDRLIYIGDIEKNEQYLDTFISTFETMNDLGFTIADFITYLENIQDYELKINVSSTKTKLKAVKLMNIHKSKGLEFPICYFSGLSKQFSKEESKKRFLPTNNFGLLIKDDEKKKSFIHNLYFNLEKQDELSEKVRLFYVALTRAREKMIFVMPELEKVVEPHKARSLQDIFSTTSSYFKIVDKNVIEEEQVNIKDKDLKNEVTLIPINIEYNEVINRTASKKLDFNANTGALEFGSKLHLLLEIVDFKTKDTSFITDKRLSNYINDFLNSQLMSKVNEAKKIYKEYQFNDQENHTTGIIDLMIDYGDHIEIIDYKLKNIEDSKYHQQLKVYKNYIEQMLKKNVELYLYSIIDRSYVKIDY